MSTREISAPNGLMIVTVRDLTISEDGRTATLEINGTTYDVLKADLFGSVQSLVDGVKGESAWNDDPSYQDMNAWVLEEAYAAGIRVEFSGEIVPGTVCTLPNPGSIDGGTFEMTALSNVVNGTVQFKFADHYQWYPVSAILATR